jgi:hypothetical protein
MNYLLKTATLLVGVVLVSSCKKDAQEITEPQPIPQETYQHGAPAGVAVKKTIGAEGGTLSTDDGTVRLTIPAGSVTKATEFSIQPVENTLPGARGKSFRLLPEGTQFTKPIILQFSYADFPMEGTVPEALFLGYQDADGKYWLVNDTALDKSGKTLTVKTTHFSDWQMCEVFRVVADKTVLKLGETAVLKLQYLVDYGSPELAPLTQVKHGWANYLLGSTETVEWGLNGEGQLIKSGPVATYKAPDTAPAENPVLVSLKFSNFIPKYIKDRWTTSTTQLILLTPITIAEKGYMTVTFKGRTITYRDAGFTDDLSLIQVSGGSRSDDYFWIHVYGHQKGAYAFGAWDSQQTGTSLMEKFMPPIRAGVWTKVMLS